MKVAILPSVSNVLTQPSKLKQLCMELASLTSVEFFTAKLEAQLQPHVLPMFTKSSPYSMENTGTTRNFRDSASHPAQSQKTGQPLMVASIFGLLPSHLCFMYVTDCANCFHFLIATGAKVSVILPSATEGPTRGHKTVENVILILKPSESIN